MTLFARIIACCLAVSVCGHVLLLDDNQTLSPRPAGLARSASLPNMGLDFGKIGQSGLDNAAGAMQDAVTGGALDMMSEEVQEIIADGQTLISTVERVAGICTAFTAGLEQGKTITQMGSEYARESAEEAGVDYLKGAAKSLKNAGKAALMASMVDGGMVSGPAAVALYGGGWLVSKFLDGAIDESCDQVGEFAKRSVSGASQASALAYLDHKGELHDAAFDEETGHVIVRIRPSRKYTKLERKNKELEALGMNQYDWWRLLTEVAETANMNFNQKQSWRRKKVDRMMEFTRSQRTIEGNAFAAKTKESHPPNGLFCTPEWDKDYKPWIMLMDELVPPQVPRSEDPECAKYSL